MWRHFVPLARVGGHFGGGKVVFSFSPTPGGCITRDAPEGTRPQFFCARAPCSVTRRKSRHAARRCARGAPRRRKRRLRSCSLCLVEEVAAATQAGNRWRQPALQFNRRTAATLEGTRHPVREDTRGSGRGKITATHGREFRSRAFCSGCGRIYRRHARRDATRGGDGGRVGPRRPKCRHGALYAETRGASRRGPPAEAPPPPAPKMTPDNAPPAEGAARDAEAFRESRRF